MLRRDAEVDLIPALLHHEIGLLPFYPLASGLLTGKVRRGVRPPSGSRLAEQRYGSWLTDEAFDLVDRLARYAEERGISLLDVAVGGLAAQPAGSSVIAGATTAEQLRSNVAAAEWQPSADDLRELDQVTRGEGPPG